jgi:outer membrane receptor protein involved in Fe transport
VLFICSILGSLSFAATDGSLSGTVVDGDGVAVANADIKVLKDTAVFKIATASATGEFSVFPLEFGDYVLSVTAPGFENYQAEFHAASGGSVNLEVKLSPVGKSKEMVITVRAKKHSIQSGESRSSVEINHDDVASLPQSDQIKLPKLISSTMPGVVSGSFGQLFFRGSHANIQYQIDGVQLPDSPSNTFGDALTPRNIDHMEVITGGIPAEYGQRLAAVVNIISKSGPESAGGSAELNYGSYNTISPTVTYGGSSETGNIHYYLSGNFNRTDRGLDTPQPIAPNNQAQGGKDAIHDYNWGHNEFAKMDWVIDNRNKLSFIVFDAFSFYQIPNYPSTFQPTTAIDPNNFFSSFFVDQFGNPAGSYNYLPPNTDDNQSEENTYIQAVWKHTFSETSFLQLAPYYKLSYIKVNNDPTNDLNAFAFNNPSSFAQERTTHNWGLKGDYTWRANQNHLVKAGMQLQASRSVGGISILTVPGGTPFTDNDPDTGFFESLYLQDDWTIVSSLTLNAGLRFDATQFTFGQSTNSSDYAFQPRVGLSYLLTENTKVHGFYGKLFQPAPLENLRDAFTQVGNGQGGQLSAYDIKAEKDDYFEVGVAQQLPFDQVGQINFYYKSATNMLDDQQLLNTSIAQPFNYATGFAYGLEISLKGNITNELTDYLNYSYEIAQGQGISGGIFAFPAGQQPSPGQWVYLDHVQIHTANAGLTYRKNNLWLTTQGLLGSGLRTGPNNSSSLPVHFTMDFTVGYEFKGNDFWSQWKVSADVLNMFDNVYPVTVANGFNGSHYAAGREYFVHVVKEL